MGFERVTLGRTGLTVARLGIASSYGTNEAMVEEAVEQGVNYLYWGAMRTNAMARGIRNVSRKNREDLVIVVHTMARTGAGMSKVVGKSLKRLGVDHLDVLLLGWRNRKPHPRLLEHAHRLRDQGLVRYLALSGHNRLLFPELEKEGRIDIFHVRYNAVHRAAEREVLERLPNEGGPGVVSFTNTCWGALLDPASMPPGESAPCAADSYRFTLSHPGVHVAVCGPNSMKQLQQDLECLKRGPMSEEEMERMRRIGDHIYRNVSPVRTQLRSIRTIRLGSLR